MSDVLLREIAARPTREEILARIHSLPPPSIDPVDIIREALDGLIQ